MPTALVTGASSGLGAEFARQLAERGSDLVLVARDESALAALAGRLTDRYGVSCEVLGADLTHAGDLSRVVARLSDDDRPVDVLVNNAGFGLPLDFARNDIESEARHLSLHVEAPMRLSHAAVRAMLARGHGRIVNVASVAGFIPRATYGACKAWLISFSRWANAHYASRGVTVTAVCPGLTRTDFHARMGLARGEEGVPGWLWLDARDVVSEGLRDTARGRAVSVPSWRYKALAWLAGILPPRLTARMGTRGR